MGSYAGQVPPQPFAVNGYFLQQAGYPYNSIPPQGAPQQPNINPRNQRPFSQPVSSSAQRQPSSRVSLPPQRKKILQIVDPDTNEEVKVSKVDAKTPHAPQSSRPVSVKIAPPTPRPLELVSDPAEKDGGNGSTVKRNTVVHSNSAPSTANVGSSISTSDPQNNLGNPSIVRDAHSEAEVPETANVLASTSGVAQSFTQSKSEGASEPPQQSTESICAAKQKSAIGEPVSDGIMHESSKSGANGQAKEIETTASDVSSPTVAETQIAEGGVHLGHSSPPSDTSPSAEGSSPDVAAKGADIAKSNGSRGSFAEESQSTETENAFFSPVTPPDPRASENTSSFDASVEMQSSSRGTVPPPSAPETTAERTEVVKEAKDSQSSGGAIATSPEDSSKSEVSGSPSNSSPPRRERPMFLEGERRVYVPNFMWSMKSVANALKVSEVEGALRSCDIFKNEISGNKRSEPRANRAVRGSGGPLSTDPRGTRAFPTHGGTGYPMVPVRGAAPPGMVGHNVNSFEFDLRSARSQAPPPAPRSSSGRDGDPRGTRQQGSRGRFDGPVRHGQNADPFIMNNAPFEKLKKSDKGWKRNKDGDDEVAAKVKSVRSLLNKLTLEKFDRIFKQILDVDITTYEVLDGIVKEIFEKTLFEPKFSGMYAKLCSRLDFDLREPLAKSNLLDPHGKPITFRRILLNNCKDEFTRFAQSSEVSDKEKSEKETDPKPKADEEEEDEKLSAEEKKAKEKQRKAAAELEATKAKRRMLANVGFIGELYIEDLLREQIIHRQCIQKLLSLGIEKKEEDVLEALCKLISKTGAKLSENREATDHIDTYFKPLHVLAKDPTLPARVRFMLQDLIEQRSNNWKVRREEAGAKTISEIHKDIEKEERAKQEAQAAARERRHRGPGGMHGRDRAPQGFLPRMAMTMAARQKVASNVSRSNAMLEKHANRNSSNMPTGLQSVRLGPGGPKMGASGAGGGGLRPGSSRLGTFAALADNRDLSGSNQSGDVRRGKPGAKWQPVPRRGGTRSEAVEIKPKQMSPDILKRKTKGLVQEFWGVGLVNEVRECVEQELKAPNYAAFVEEMLRLAIDSKIDERKKTVQLFDELVGRPIPGRDFITAFTAVISDLPDLEFDNPRVLEFVTPYIGASAATGKLGSEDCTDFGLVFLTSTLSALKDAKQKTKLVVHSMAQLFQSLASKISDDEERRRMVRQAYMALNFDAAEEMGMWNPMRGLSVLEELLKETGTGFLVPHLSAEKTMKDKLNSDPSCETVCTLMKSWKTSLDGEMMRILTRVSLDWLLMSPPENLKQKFVDVFGSAVVQCFGPEFERDVQMEAVLQAQSYITRNLEVLPPVSGDDKPGAIAFEVLYDADLVEEDTFLKWKEDTDRSLKTVGKDKMLIQTSRFFKWLAEAEQ